MAHWYSNSSWLESDISDSVLTEMSPYEAKTVFSDQVELWANFWGWRLHATSISVGAPIGISNQAHGIWLKVRPGECGQPAYNKINISRENWLSPVIQATWEAPWCASHSRVNLLCVHHAAESDFAVCIKQRTLSQNVRTWWSNISAKSKPNSKILKPVYQGPVWVRIMKKMEVKNLVTHSL